MLSNRARGGHCLAKYCYYFDNFVEVVGCMSVLFGGSEHQLTCKRALFLRLRQLPTGVVDAIPNFCEKVALAVAVKHQTRLRLFFNWPRHLAKSKGRDLSVVYFGSAIRYLC